MAKSKKQHDSRDDATVQEHASDEQSFCHKVDDATTISRSPDAAQHVRNHSFIPTGLAKLGEEAVVQFAIIPEDQRWSPYGVPAAGDVRADAMLGLGKSLVKENSEMIMKIIELVKETNNLVKKGNELVKKGDELVKERKEPVTERELVKKMILPKENGLVKERKLSQTRNKLVKQKKETRARMRQASSKTSYSKALKSKSRSTANFSIPLSLANQSAIEAKFDAIFKGLGFDTTNLKISPYASPYPPSCPVPHLHIATDHSAPGQISSEPALASTTASGYPAATSAKTIFEMDLCEKEQKMLPVSEFDDARDETLLAVCRKCTANAMLKKRKRRGQ